MESYDGCNDGMLRDVHHDCLKKGLLRTHGFISGRSLGLLHLIPPPRCPGILHTGIRPPGYLKIFVDKGFLRIPTKKRGSMQEYF
jgi:hypothetical protein